MNPVITVALLGKKLNPNYWSCFGSIFWLKSLEKLNGILLPDPNVVRLLPPKPSGWKSHWKSPVFHDIVPPLWSGVGTELISLRHLTFSKSLWKFKYFYFSHQDSAELHCFTFTFKATQRNFSGWAPLQVTIASALAWKWLV